MKRVLVTQRVDLSTPGGMRHDSLDQAWSALLSRCELLPVLVPNNLNSATQVVSQSAWDGLLLTGGNSLLQLGGDAPERDEVEAMLLRRALAAELPVVGVCRGMQLLLDHFGVALVEVDGHVQEHQEIEIEGKLSQVNSYHRWGCHRVASEFEVWARAEDGVVKAVRHRQHRATGIMWHPERMEPLRTWDIEFLQREFAATAQAKRKDPCEG